MKGGPVMQGKKSNTKENRMNKNNKRKQTNREFNKNRNEVLEEREDIIIGRNAVIEALKNDSRTIETLYISNNMPYFYLIFSLFAFLLHLF